MLHGNFFINFIKVWYNSVFKMLSYLQHIPSETIKLLFSSNDFSRNLLTQNFSLVINCNSSPTSTSFSIKMDYLGGTRKDFSEDSMWSCLIFWQLCLWMGRQAALFQLHGNSCSMAYRQEVSAVTAPPIPFYLHFLFWGSLFPRGP